MKPWLGVLIGIELLQFGLFALVVHGILWAGPHPSWGSGLYFAYSSIGYGISLGQMDYRIMCGIAWELDQTRFMVYSSFKLLPVFVLAGVFAMGMVRSCVSVVKLPGGNGRSTLKRNEIGV